MSVNGGFGFGGNPRPRSATVSSSSFPTDDLVSYHQFDNDLLDSGPNGKNASGGTPTYDTGVIGQALNGSAGISISPALDLGTTFSVSYQVRLSSYPALGTVLAMSGFNGLYFSSTSEGFPCFYNGDFRFATTSVPLNTWTHVVMTYDGTTIRWYVNSVAAGTNVTAIPAFDAANIASIAGASVLTGRIDLLGTWTTVLSQQDVDALYNGGAGLDYP